MNISFLNEPELEFGLGRHVDVRFGINDYYPFDSRNRELPREINVGIVGTPQSVERTSEWLEKCRSEIPAKETNKYNLFPKFCGLNINVGFKSLLVLDKTAQQIIQERELKKLFVECSTNEIIQQSSSLFYENIEYLVQNKKCDVILCALPVILLEKILTSKSTMQQTEPDENQPEEIEKTENFRRMLKAKAMHLGKPIQLILPHTYGDNSLNKLRLDDRTTQDEATRAWNFSTALYYKAGGTPWRLPKQNTDITTCYIGISFYESLDRSSLQTSLAQIFDERGAGIVWRGGKLTKEDEDRHPYLAEKDAHLLLIQALEKYKIEHKNMPGRVVIHKSSNYHEAELRGFQNALIEKGIDCHDFLTIFRSDIRLFRKGAYPPLRGTKLSIDEDTHILYTRGSVPFYETYPGKYVPRSLELRCVDVQQDPNLLCKEILSLTKMNWNNTEFDGLWPITIKGSRQVGDILKYLPPDVEKIEPRYSFYM
jgi:hypothetical protein